VKSSAGQVFNELRLTLPGLRALVVLGPAGEVVGQATAAEFKAENFTSELATLLRIAQHAVLDTGMGELHEQILLAKGATTIIQRVSPDRFAILVFPPDESVGRLRYELKRGLLYSTLSNL
jgi:predicted regulator of Ras-like GTPase activity (Roadblock/LC7/MglB family)